MKLALLRRGQSPLRLTGILVIAWSVSGCASGTKRGEDASTSFDAQVEPGCADDTACDDGVDCTVDVCDPASRTCSSEASDELCAPTDRCVAERGCEMRPPCESDDDCDDGLFCNGVETCDRTLGCQSGVAPACDDGLGCTDDACDDAMAACTHVPNDALCGDGIFCNGEEACRPDDDAADANGCVIGEAVVCDDEIGCTVDTCSEAVGGCEHAPSDALCDDDVFCDGVEICDADAGCTEGSPPSCDDEVACTMDRCDTEADACEHTPDDGACVDANVCDGDETCDATLGCVAGTPVDCSDGIACTTDRCFGDGMCEHLGSDADMDGFEAEGCASGADCDDLVPGINPDADEVCDGVDNDCSGAADDGAGMECVLGSAPVACTVPDCGTAGTSACTDGCARGPCLGLEVCNGCDDDGSGTADDGLGMVCALGSSQDCINTECGVVGRQLCLGDCSGYSRCIAETETCNACDDDGDGRIDEGGGLVCERSATESCTTTCGTTGTRTCELDCSGWSECIAEEVCNGCDDDGDGAIDEPNPCRRGETESCIVPVCGTAGTRTCADDCSGFGACTATMDTCGNDCDDDGNGVADDGCEPANPNAVCAGAISLTGRSGTRSDSFAELSRTVTDCGLGGELWYRVSLSARQILYLDTFGSDFDTSISIRTSCGGAALQCEDDDCGTVQDQLVRVLSAGTYYIAVHAFFSSTTSGNIQLRWQAADTGNGDFTRITASGTYSGVTSGTGTHTASCSSASGPEDGFFFTRCPGESSTVSANTCSGTSWDTVLSLEDGVGSAIDCDDDGCGSIFGPSTVSGLAAGPGVFVLLLEGWSTSDAGSYSLSVSGL